MDILILILLLPVLPITYVLGLLLDTGYYIVHRKWPNFPWGPGKYLGIGGSVLVGAPIGIILWILILYEVFKHVSIHVS